MNGNGFFVIISRQFQQKWGRFILASAGIMVGIWAISLTTSLSLGLSDTIVTAINSQPFAREITVTRTETGQTSFFEVTEAPVFKPLSQSELAAIVDDNNSVVAASPDTDMNIFVHSSDQAQTCVKDDVVLTQNRGGQQFSPPSEQGVDPDAGQTEEVSQEEFDQNCQYFMVSAASFENFYENNRADWIGKTQLLSETEIATCFQCGDVNLSQKLGVANPEDLIGQTITIEYQRAPDVFEAGKVLDVANFDAQDTAITASNPLELTVAAVIDDRGDNVFGPPPLYLDFIHFQRAFEVKNPDKDFTRYGALQNTVFINDFEELESTVNSLQQQEYLAFSLALTLISAIEVAFLVLTWVLAGFGFIALIASVFGIINVMTISVLERKKEIGILKSLGARDRDVFVLFFSESAMLGVFGWLLGMGLSLLVGVLISMGFDQAVAANPDWSESLETLNITDFSPTFPWWLFAITFVLAVSFTAISGVFPAISAARQNPVDVLRSE